MASVGLLSGWNNVFYSFIGKTLPKHMTTFPPPSVVICFVVDLTQ